MSDDVGGRLPPDNNGSRLIGPRGMKRYISREEAGGYIAAASLKVGEKIYDEISKEHARVFAEMEQRLNAKFEKRLDQLARMAMKLPPDVSINWPEESDAPV